MLECKYMVDLPYPQTNITQHNQYEVKLLMPVYAGRESETTAIMQYTYQHYVIDETFSDISSCLEHIGITEMHHHDLLGIAITQLGGTPYIGGNYGYWQGGYVNYTKDIKSILDIDILGEKKAIEGYKNVIMRAQTEEIKTLIKRIILDEELHLRVLTEIREGLNVPK